MLVMYLKISTWARKFIANAVTQRIYTLAMMQEFRSKTLMYTLSTLLWDITCFVGHNAYLHWSQ